MTEQDEVEFVTTRLSDRFWSILELARNDWPAFQKLLGEMSPRETWQLRWTYQAALALLLLPPYVDYAADYLGEDSREQLATWIVAQGKKFYMDVIDDPACIPPDTPDEPYADGHHPLAEICRIYAHEYGVPEDDSYFLD